MKKQGRSWYNILVKISSIVLWQSVHILSKILIILSNHFYVHAHKHILAYIISLDK